MQPAQAVTIVDAPDAFIRSLVWAAKERVRLR
jgi:hypothetical protein